MRHQGEGERAAGRRGEIGEHMKECISEGEGEIDWDGEMGERIKRSGGERKEGVVMKLFFFLL